MSGSGLEKLNQSEVDESDRDTVGKVCLKLTENKAKTLK